MDPNAKIVITGGAGLVGQNLVVRLKARGWENLVVIDKHSANLKVLRERDPDLTVIESDLARPGNWETHFADAASVVMLHAQIGGHELSEFAANNVDSTERVLEAMRQHGVEHLVHISSSVVESKASDFYTNTKKQQEELVVESGIPSVVLRPTLMFGWFDRKHLGWLSRFMRKIPVFPIPGDGRFMRQPLFAGDLCNIIAACIEKRLVGGPYDITGLEQVDYVDIIRTIKRTIGSNTLILHIPYRLFWVLLWIWGLFDRNPPFTTQQLEALVARDEFDVIDWPGIFGVQATPFESAIEETFAHPVYSQIELQF